MTETAVEPVPARARSSVNNDEASTCVADALFTLAGIIPSTPISNYASPKHIMTGHTETDQHMLHCWSSQVKKL